MLCIVRHTKTVGIYKAALLCVKLVDMAHETDLVRPPPLDQAQKQSVHNERLKFLLAAVIAMPGRNV